eukprot:TRINITY_DN71937_c0_g1_i1.p1 TRINITY_DN71937_c0_g1~~TRINITY_DN71937_c0_g1_i1.p1  ORF type:complete len:715 (-),score=116.06 TRINITY_DN71937_c0_g1_i1:45-1877(-)
MEVRYFGHPCPRYALTTYLCAWARSMLPPSESARASEEVADILVDMVNITDQHVETSWDVHSTLARLGTVYASDAYLSRADFWLCSGPAVLCALLHATAPEKPMVVWHCRHLLDGIGALANATKTLIFVSLRHMVAQSSGVAMIACERFASVQASLQLGIPPPAVHRRLGLYAEAHAWRAYGEGGRPREVLVMRSMLWTRLPGLYFRALLDAFLNENRKWLRLTLAFASDFTEGLLPYSEMVAYRCAVLVPNDLTMASFVEAYTMGIPLFMPTDEWLYRLQKSVPYGFMVNDGRLPVPHISSSIADVADVGDHETSSAVLEPFWKERLRSPANVLHWLGISDFSTWPHSQRFSSIPELLRALITADLQAVSSGMREWLAQGKEEFLPKWAAVVTRVMLPEVAKEAEPADLEASARQQAASRGKVHLQRGSEADESHRKRLLYAGLACEHASFDAGGWRGFRALVDRSAEHGFPMDEAVRSASTQALQGATALASAGTPGIDAGAWNARVREFLSAAQQPDMDGDAAIRGLNGHCQLGIISALLLQVRHDIERSEQAPALISSAVSLAGELWQPVEDADPARERLPVGAWPVDLLMAKVSELLTAAGTASR